MSTARFKTGDKVVAKIYANNCWLGREENVEYLRITDADSSVYSYEAYDKDDKLIANCSCYSDKDLEPYQGGTVSNTRRTFKLLKETPSLTKGALFQEDCDDGTQPYSLITPEHRKSKTDQRRMNFTDRSEVEDQPTWFVEVFQVEPQYMTASELEQFETFKKSLKTKSKAKTVKTKSKTSTKVAKRPVGRPRKVQR